MLSAIIAWKRWLEGKFLSGLTLGSMIALYEFEIPL